MRNATSEPNTSIFATLLQRSTAVLAALAAVTALLVVPFLTMAPETSASTEPSGAVFTARDRIDESFVSSVHPVLMIVESESGDLLQPEPLRQLLAMAADLRSDPTIGATLLTYYDVDTNTEVTGVLTVADLVEGELQSQGLSLAAADRTQVKQAGRALIEQYGLTSDSLGLSEQSQIIDGEWIVPAAWFPVLSDNDALGFGNTSVTLGGDTSAEEFDRELRDFFRAEGWITNGVAIDVNLTSQEQGAIAGPFIGLTILAVLLLVGLTFRSYWILATVSVAFMALIVWLKGISNLIGLKDDLVLSLIVPVAMVSFGVDFAFHAIGRYREERAEGREATTAFVTGMSAVSAALLLAFASDTTAFLSNMTSGIESINQFGLGAAIALASAYLLLGIATPLAITRIEASVPEPTPGRRSSTLRLLASVGAAMMTMASVLLMVFVLPWLGIVLAMATTLAVLVVPVVVRRRAAGVRAGQSTTATREASLAKPIGRVVAAIARRSRIVIPVAVAVSVVAALFALQVPAEFDVEDFFAADTDFVVGLDQVEDHIGQRGGEPARLFVEGDLRSPASLAAVQSALDSVRNDVNSPLARDAAGNVEIEGGIFTVFDATWDSMVMVDIVAQQTGVLLTDANADLIPDTAEQIEALIAVSGTIGVPLDQGRLIFTPNDVRTRVALGTDGQADRTVFDMGVPNSRSQEAVAAARMTLEPVAEKISTELGGSFVQVTGSAFLREASLNATNNALQVSLPIALLACLAISSFFLRSFRYGFASILPILMVVSWLYAFMHFAGYAINLVTATIAAVSIGIGIDFAIHFIARYREELERYGVRDTAVRIAGEGTGLALVASAVSSAIGFGILGLAPMPLFAAYGLLTALMIGFALVATLVVLPSVLVAITRDRVDDFAIVAEASTIDLADETPVMDVRLAGGRSPAGPYALLVRH